MELPNVGLVQLQDNETGAVQWFDTSKSQNRDNYKTNALRKHGEIKENMRRGGVDHTKIATHQSYIQPLMTLFKRRGTKR